MQDPEVLVETGDTATNTDTIANETAQAAALVEQESNKAAGEPDIPNVEFPNTKALQDTSSST